MGVMELKESNIVLGLSLLKLLINLKLITEQTAYLDKPCPPLFYTRGFHYNNLVLNHSEITDI